LGHDRAVRRKRRLRGAVQPVRAVAGRALRHAGARGRGPRPAPPGGRRVPARQGDGGPCGRAAVGRAAAARSGDLEGNPGAMVAPLAVATAVKGLGVVAAALAASGAVALPSARGRAVSALLALLVTPVLLVGELWSSPQIEHVRHRPGLAAAALAGGILLVAALAVAFTRWPGLLPVLAVAALPFRLPLESGGQSANLLVPLYLVVAGGVLAYCWQRLGPPGRRYAKAGGNGFGQFGDWRDVPVGRLELA